MVMLNVIKLTWPFFKEMIIGRNSLRYAMRKNRVKVLFFFVVMLSFVVNWITVPRLFMISSDYIKLEKEFKATKETMATYKDDVELVEQAKDELIVLRAKVKELDGKQCLAPTPFPSVKHDIEHVRTRLNNLGS